MTVSSTQTRISYSGDSVTVVFPVPFGFYASTDLLVVLDGVTKTLNTDYTVTGGGGSTGNVVMNTAPAAATNLQIILDPPITNTVNYVDGTEFPAATLNQQADRIVQVALRLDDEVSRTLHGPDGPDTTPMSALPAASSRAGKYLAFDPSGQPLASFGTGNDSALRTDLASQAAGADGARLVGRRRSEAGAAATTLTALLDREMYAEDFGANTTPGTTNMRAAIQAAITAATAVNSQIFLHTDNALGSPLLLTSTSQQNISLIGRGRVSTILRPNASNISAGPQNVNCLIFNQKDNGHLHLEKLRWFDAGANTGVFMYATEGGGGDLSGQAAFSMDVTDCWFSPSSNNSGCFRGGYSNLQVTRATFESIKTGCWVLEGVGNADQFHAGIVMNNCYDSYIYGVLDTQTKAIIEVNGLHAYGHFRGPLFEIKNAIDVRISNVSLEANAAQVGNVGLYKFTDCKDIDIRGGTATIANSSPRIACGFESINGNTGHIRGLIVNADVGIRISGTGVLDLTFEDCDFTGCQYSFQHLSGNASGKIRFINCRLNNDEYGMLTSAGAPTYTVDFIGGEIMNAGYDGTAPGVTTGRNVSLANTGATIRFVGTKIGHDDVKATATHRFNMVGTGTVLVQEPYLVGTPPTAFAQGTQALTYDGVDSTMPGMPAFVPSLGGSTTYTVQTGSWSLKGGRVHFSGEITVNALGTGSNNTISGLPFTVGAGTPGVGFVSQFSGLAVTPVSLGLLCISGTATATLKGLVAAAAATATQNAMQNGADIRFSGSYTL